jgi:hypothetical protein
MRKSIGRFDIVQYEMNFIAFFNNNASEGVYPGTTDTHSQFSIRLNKPS